MHLELELDRVRVRSSSQDHASSASAFRGRAGAGAGDLDDSDGELETTAQATGTSKKVRACVYGLIIKLHSYASFADLHAQTVLFFYIYISYYYYIILFDILQSRTNEVMDAPTLFAGVRTLDLLRARALDV